MPLATTSIYFENAAGRVSEHPNQYAVLSYHPGKRAKADFQALLTHLGHLLQRRGWHKVLTDQRVLSPFTDEERQWINDQWMSPDLKVGREIAAAVLLPEDVFARLATNLVMHNARAGSLVYHIFQEPEAAAAWLRQAP